jgi:prophage regulatory protein
MLIPGDSSMLPIILRLPAVVAMTGTSRSSVYLRIANGLFPRPVRVGSRAVGWPASEIAAINNARIAGQTDEDIRALVRRLHGARSAAANMMNLERNHAAGDEFNQPLDR